MGHIINAIHSTAPEELRAPPIATRGRTPRPTPRQTSVRACRCDRTLTVALRRRPHRRRGIAVSALRPSVEACWPAAEGHRSVEGAPAIRGGADVSVTVRLDPKVKAAIAEIGDDAWIPDRVHRRPLRRNHPAWISRAEVAEIAIHRVRSRKAAEQVPGRLVVRRIPDLNPDQRRRAGHPVRHLALPRVLHHHRPGHRHRRQDPPRPRDHRAGPRRPERLRPGSPALGTFTANAAWLVLAVIAFNLTRAAATLTGTAAGQAPHRHHPPHADHRAGTDRVLGPTPDPAPTARLALGTAWNTLFDNLFRRHQPLIA